MKVVFDVSRSVTHNSCLPCMNEDFEVLMKCCASAIHTAHSLKLSYVSLLHRKERGASLSVFDRSPPKHSVATQVNVAAAAAGLSTFALAMAPHALAAQEAMQLAEVSRSNMLWPKKKRRAVHRKCQRSVMILSLLHLA